MDVTTLLRLSELKRRPAERGVALRFDNVSPRVVELARRARLDDRFAT